MLVQKRVATASPRTRGWTRDDDGVEVGLYGFPAHAGMDPVSLSRTA